ncbi:agmatine deiminase family protein [Aquibacillus salsiterrae]|uniref:Agmatine deiminase family protein n=1 Tax=Aquibacillus salsiterrae TaxID=2950439 RepID=A0A9X3WGF9_9BACI|nr:agmatine deiminase family protein [Aquibacillus salsiterrae]MDC3416989.1 agmatine deiminase family protein [Aquibacillus salsiterrae]
MQLTKLDYSMPAEWELHDRTLIAWPVKESMVYPEQYEQVCAGYQKIIEAISEFEPVTVIVNKTAVDTISKKLTSNQITLLAIDHNDAWLRDNGPTFLINQAGERAAVNWQFNAWGEKYMPYDLDDQVANEILHHFQIKSLDAPLVMEGGSIHVDGEGTLITTEECLLHPNRNPNLSKSEIENILKKYLNVSKIIWLKRGLSGDETDGHVDNVACFVAPGKVMIQVCDDKEDDNYPNTIENLAILQNETDALGRKIDIVPIKQPPRRYFNGKRLTLSYLNYYFVNGGIILPVFGEDAKFTDEMAMQALQELFPSHKIRTVDGMAIIREGGNVHCTTQQMVAGK